MATHTTLASLFNDIADAIRAKTGEESTIVADTFPEAIAAIETGTEWTSGIYQDEDGFICVSPLAGAGGVRLEDGHLIFSPNSSDAPTLGVLTITENGTYDISQYLSVIVNISGGE